MQRDSKAVMWIAIALGVIVTVINGMLDDLCGLAIVTFMVWAVYKYFKR